jgi:hypothetical protein
MALPLDLITGAMGFLFTILIFSYVFGDNPLFKISIYLFAGVSAGYVAAVAFWQVLWPRLIYPLIFGSPLDKAFLALPLLGSVLILMKISPRLAGLARVTMAYLVGVGAAVTIAGAVAGTLLPQITGTINVFDKFDIRLGLTAQNLEILFSGSTILAGVIFSLAYFQFSAKPKADGTMHRNFLVETMALVGRFFIGITLGAVFAGVYAAALTALIERVSSLVNFVGKFF